jgi:hypothetical protein
MQPELTARSLLGYVGYDIEQFELQNENYT